MKPRIDLRTAHNAHVPSNTTVVGVEGSTGNCLITCVDTGRYLLIQIHGLNKKTIVRVGAIPRDDRGQPTHS